MYALGAHCSHGTNSFPARNMCFCGGSTATCSFPIHNVCGRGVLFYTIPLRPTVCISSGASPVVAVHAAQMVPYWERRQWSLMKDDLWCAPDWHPLCYHCDEASQIYRQCPSCQLGVRGFPIDSSCPPRFGEWPQEIDEYVIHCCSPPDSP